MAPRKTMKKTAVAVEEPVGAKLPEIETEKPKPVTRTSAPKPQFQPNDMIMCRSVTAGKLVYIGQRTGTKYMWANVGDVAWLEYQDLMSAILSRSAYVFSPLFVIEDESILDTPQCRDLKKLYDTTFKDVDVEQIMALPLNQFKETIKTLPVGIRNSLKSEIVSGIERGTFDSIQKINAVDEEFDTDIKSLIN